MTYNYIRSIRISYLEAMTLIFYTANGSLLQKNVFPSFDNAEDWLNLIIYTNITAITYIRNKSWIGLHLLWSWPSLVLYNWSFDQEIHMVWPKWFVKISMCTVLSAKNFTGCGRDFCRISSCVVWSISTMLHYSWDHSTMIIVIM